MINANEKVKLLKSYFLQRPDVTMAFLFGSYAKNTAISESDFDIAIYFEPETKAIEWEEERFYPQEDKIWGDVEKLAGLKTDLIVLNRAPASLAFSVIQGGVPIVIKDRALYLRFLLTISSAAEYFREFTKDFWAIKQRASSLNEADKNRLIRITDFMETELNDYSKFINLEQGAYEANTAVRRNVERWVENIVNSSIDIAKIILASEKKRIPQTYREVMEELALLDNFDKNSAERLAAFAKLRNILAHEYLDIRFRQIKRFIQESEPAYKELLRFVKSLLLK
ncbi:MAG: HepT-like ribonuclease domain-containing protein [Candidatus Omnitrophota bacterium]|nr:HepT-like ribonuclease domain-containing protein [Candidatus Omnitrophota bacterium]